jgi:hypothetical protein
MVVVFGFVGSADQVLVDHDPEKKYSIREHQLYQYTHKT